MNDQAKCIWEKVAANKGKLKECHRHEFKRMIGSRRYRCENCGGEVDVTSAHYYKEGLKHGKEEINNRKKTFVISAFPGCGKSYCFGAYKDNFAMLDSDSSRFSWVVDENGESTGERHPDFPSNYIEHIKSNIGKVDIIFVSSHDIVRDALRAADIKTVMVSPKREMKDIWLDRLSKRGSEDKFVDFISSKWNDFIDGMENDTSENVVLRLVLDEAMPYITKDILEALTKKCQSFGN